MTGYPYLPRIPVPEGAPMSVLVIEYHRNPNPLGQRHGYRRRVNGRKLGGPGEFHRDLNHALRMAVRTSGVYVSSGTDTFRTPYYETVEFRGWPAGTFETVRPEIVSFDDGARMVTGHALAALVEAGEAWSVQMNTDGDLTWVAALRDTDEGPVGASWWRSRIGSIAVRAIPTPARYRSRSSWTPRGR